MSLKPPYVARGRASRAAASWLVAAGFFYCLPAWAHGGLGDGKSLWGGALHFLTSPLSLAAVFGLMAALFGLGERPSLIAAAVAGGGAALASGLQAFLPAWAAPAGVVVIGLAAVAALKPAGAAALLLALLGGAAAGLAADLDAPSWQGAIGIGGCVMFLLGCALAAFHDLQKIGRLQPVLPIAGRVLGSWVAAMGLLMSSLALRPGGV